MVRCFFNPFRMGRLPAWKEEALKKRLHEMEKEIDEPESLTTSVESWNGFVVASNSESQDPEWSPDSYALEDIFPQAVQDAESGDQEEVPHVEVCPGPPSTPQNGVPPPQQVCIRALCRVQAMILCGELEVEEEDKKEEVVGGDPKDPIMTLHDFHRHRDRDMERRRRKRQGNPVVRFVRWFCGVVREPSFSELRVHCCQEYQGGADTIGVDSSQQ
ncbi:hypothetical protein BSKO_08373 [Bryopsis sp. KO-2023]|nr:hypothetical protein BSKO_08373 [Bryopsis sp. KO-2023]